MCSKIFLLVNFGLPLIVFLYILRIYLKHKSRNSLNTKFQCWFCGMYHEISKEFINCWDCPSCDQYNGFSEDGGYNKPILAQYDASLNPTRRRRHLAEATNTASDNGLCSTCNANQCFKVANIANFWPGHDQKHFDKEYHTYKQYLEKMYPLCSRCERFLAKKIEADKSLIGFQHGSPTQRNMPSNPQDNTTAAVTCSLVVLNTCMALACLTADHVHKFPDQPFGHNANFFIPSSAFVPFRHVAYYDSFCRYVIHVGCLLSLTIFYLAKPALGTSPRNRGYRNKSLDCLILCLWFVCFVARSIRLLNLGTLYNLDKALTLLCLIRLFKRSYPQRRADNLNGKNIPSKKRDDQRIGRRSNYPASYLSHKQVSAVGSDKLGFHNHKNISPLEPMDCCKSEYGHSTLSRRLVDSCSISGARSSESTVTGSTSRTNIFLQKPKLRLTNPSSSASTYSTNIPRWINNQRPLFAPSNTSPSTNTSTLYDLPTKGSRSEHSWNGSMAGLSPTKSTSGSQYHASHYSRPSSNRSKQTLLPPNYYNHSEDEGDYYASPSTLHDSGLSATDDSGTPELRFKATESRCRPMFAGPQRSSQPRTIEFYSSNNDQRGTTPFILFALGLSIGINSVCAWNYFSQNFVDF